MRFRDSLKVWTISLFLFLIDILSKIKHVIEMPSLAENKVNE